MANWYLDYKDGSDNYSGDVDGSGNCPVTPTLTQTDGVANGSTTFTSVLGGFTGLSGRKIYIVGKGGRTISSVNNDNSVVLDSSVTAGSGLTFNVGGRRRLISGITSANCNGLAGSDTVRVAQDASPVASSYDLVIGNGQRTAAVVSKTKTLVTDCESNWTASGSVTCSLVAGKVGTNAVQIVIATGFTTGKAAYFDLGSTQDYSAFHSLTFWFKFTAGVTLPTTTSHTIRLCSDSAGVTSVATYNLPTIDMAGYLEGKRDWLSATFGTAGVALPSNVRSIAFYVTTDQAAQTFVFDDFRVAAMPNITKTVDLCDTAWTAAANVTTTASTTRKQGTNSCQIAVAAGFTTGQAAYKTISSTDFSGFTGLSFWLRQNSGTVATTGDLQIKLCSDTLGATPVDTFDVPALGAVNRWYPVNIDLGAALGAAIQSISFHVLVDRGAQTFLIDNVQATISGNDHIGNETLIGHANSLGCGGTDATAMWCIASIVDGQIIIDQGGDTTPTTTIAGYCGESVVDTCYTLSPTPLFFLSGVESLNSSFGSLSGGWDKTNMASQSGYSWLDRNGYSIVSTVLVENLVIVRPFTTAISPSVNATLTRVSVINLAGIGIQTLAAFLSWTDGIVAQGSSSAVGITFFSTGGQFVVDDIKLLSLNNAITGSTLGFLTGKTVTIANITSTIITAAADIEDITIRNGITCIATNRVKLRNATIFGMTTLFSGVDGEILTGTISTCSIIMSTTVPRSLVLCNVVTSAVLTPTSLSNGTDGGIKWIRKEDTDDSHRIDTDSLLCLSQTSVRHTASGIAWSMAVTGTTRQAAYPGKLPLGTYAVPAGSSAIKVWLRRTNTGLTLGLVCRRYQLPGMTVDASAFMTAAADTWEEVTINISPTSAGVIELEVWAYGGTTYTGYVDDLTVDGVASPLDYAYQGSPAAPPLASGSSVVAVSGVAFGRGR